MEKRIAYRIHGPYNAPPMSIPEVNVLVIVDMGRLPPNEPETTNFA